MAHTRLIKVESPPGLLLYEYKFEIETKLVTFDSVIVVLLGNNVLFVLKKNCDACIAVGKRRWQAILCDLKRDQTSSSLFHLFSERSIDLNIF